MTVLHSKTIEGFRITEVFPDDLTAASERELRTKLGKIYEKCIENGEITPRLTNTDALSSVLSA